MRFERGTSRIQVRISTASAGLLCLVLKRTSVHILSLLRLSGKSATTVRIRLVNMQIFLYIEIRISFLCQPVLLLYLFRCSVKRAIRSSKICIHIKIMRRLKVNIETSQIPFSCANSPPCSSNQQYSVPWDGLLL